MNEQDIVVLRSKENPDRIVVVGRGQYRAVMDRLRDENPDDGLIAVPTGAVAPILRQIADQNEAASSLQSDGFYRYSLT